MDRAEWVRCDDAVRELQRHLKAVLGATDPAPWSECEQEWHETPEQALAHRWVARTSLTLRRAFLTGDMRAYFVKDAHSRPVPGWAWENASASASAFNYGWLLIDPFLQFELQECENWQCYVRKPDLIMWLKNGEIAQTGKLPNLPQSFDLGSKPQPIKYSEPLPKPYVGLTEALTWAAFGLAMSSEVFGIAEHCRYGPFQTDTWQDMLRDTVARFSEKGGGGLIRVRGRYVANYFDHQAAANADTGYLGDRHLRDYACFDSLHGGLEWGSGLTWKPKSLDGVLNARTDGWRDVEVNRADLLKELSPLAVIAKAASFEQVVQWCRDWIAGGKGNDGNKAWKTFSDLPNFNGCSRDDVFRPAWEIAKRR